MDPGRRPYQEAERAAQTVPTVGCKSVHRVPVPSPVRLSAQGVAERVQGGDRDRQWAVVQLWVLREHDSDPSWPLHTYVWHLISLCLSFPGCRWHSW